MTDRLIDVLDSARQNIATLRGFGHPETADALQRIVDAMTATRELRAVLKLHDEKGAAMMSGRAVAYYRARFKAWEARGLAVKNGRTRMYAEAVIEFKEHLHSIDAEAEAAAEADRHEAAA